MVSLDTGTSLAELSVSKERCRVGDNGSVALYRELVRRVRMSVDPEGPTARSASLDHVSRRAVVEVLELRRGPSGLIEWTRIWN